MSKTNLFYVGCYSQSSLLGTGQIVQGLGKGIYAGRFDPATGDLSFVGLTEGVPNPSYLCFDASRRFLYAVNEIKEFEGKFGGSVSAFAMDTETGKLRFLNAKAAHGTDPCHLMVNPTGKFVLTANFMSGSVCVMPINKDGSLGDTSDFIQHEGESIDPIRQRSAHAHAICMDASGRFVYVPDLGIDKIVIYKFDADRGKLLPAKQPWVQTKAGAGPRQCVFHPNGEFLYLINELDSTVDVYRFNKDDGSLTSLQTITTLPPGYAEHSTCAEVQVSPSGRFLYGSNRGHNSIAVFRIDPAKGTLSVVGHESTGGEIPRCFAVGPMGATLFAANQDTNNIVGFNIDATTGMPVPTGKSLEIATPICIKFV